MSAQAGSVGAGAREDDRAAVLFDALIESTPHAIALYALGSGIIRYANLGMVTLTGRARSGLVGARVQDVISEAQSVAGEFSDGRLNGQYTLYLPAGRFRVIDARTELVALDGASHGHLVAWDVTEQAGEQREMAYRATHDGLTGLANENAALSYLTNALRRLRGEPTRAVAVIYLDLDGLKGINDAHGHQVGDRIVAEAGARLASVTRAGDLAARLHGDEFVVICTVRNTIHAAHIVDRIRTTLSGSYQIGDVPVRAPASMGVAVAVDPATDADALVRCADQRMYIDKRQARRPFRIA